MYIVNTIQQLEIDAIDDSERSTMSSSEAKYIFQRLEIM